MIIWIDQLQQSATVGKVEPTTSLTPNDLFSQVAERAGYGLRGSVAAGLSVDQETEVGLYVSEGYRTFLLAHEWSFTRPVVTSVLWKTTLATTTMTVGGGGNKTITASASTFFPTMVGHTIKSTNGSYVIDGYLSATVVTVTTDASLDTGLAFQITANGSYRLPDDFGGLIGDAFFASGDGRWFPLTQAGVAELLELQQISTGSGRPTTVAVDPLAVTGPQGQKHDLLVWRLPSQNHTIRYQYQVLADALSDNQFPYGGAMHAETLKYACLSAMELSKKDLDNGPLTRRFKELLALSIRRDNRGSRADSLGFLVNAQAVNRFSGGNFLPSTRNVTVGGQSFP